MKTKKSSDGFLLATFVTIVALSLFFHVVIPIPVLAALLCQSVTGVWVVWALSVLGGGMLHWLSKRHPLQASLHQTMFFGLAWSLGAAVTTIVLGTNLAGFVPALDAALLMVSGTFLGIIVSYAVFVAKRSGRGLMVSV